MPSSNIDKRIVEMDFDNARFEKNCAQSISTLDKLKNALNLGDAAKGFNQLEKQANSVDFSGLERSISNIEHRFSALGIAGATIVSNLTNKAIGAVSKLNNAVFGQMKSGGISRALNLEHANFMMEGLLKDAGKVAEAMASDGPVQKAVRGTAYGLDAAANAAAQFIASGVKDSEKLEQALTGISGVASMTGSSYEDMASIFTTVAGQGKVMTMQLRQIEARGLNAAAALGEYLGKSEAEVRDMVTKGKVSFEEFSEAMNKAFGDQAKKANETFTGAMSNVKAALSRIGAKVAAPTIENIRVLFVDLITVIDNASKSLQPLIDFINNAIFTVADGIDRILNNTEGIDGVITNIVGGIGELIRDIYSLVLPIKRAFESIFPPATMDGAVRLTANLKDLIATFRLTADQMVTVRRIFQGFFGAIDIAVQIISALARVLFPAVDGVKGLASGFAGSLATLGDYIYAISQVLRETDAVYAFFVYLKGKLGPIADFIGSKIQFVIGLFKELSKTHISMPDAGGALTKLADAFKKNASPLESIGNFFKVIFGGIGSVIKEFSPLLGSFADVCGNALSQIGHAIETVLTGGGFKTLLALVNSAFLVTIGLDIAAFIHHIIGSISSGMKLIDGIKGLFTSISTHVKVMTQSVKADILIKISKAIAIFAGSLFLLSLIDPEALTRSLIAITVMMAELLGVLYLFTKISDSLNNAVGLISGAISFAAIGAGILMLAGAMKVIADIDAGRLEAALGVVTALLVELTAVTLILGNFGTKVKTGVVGILAFAVAIKILGSAMAQIGNLEPEQLVKGIIGMTAAMIELSAAALVIGDSGFGVRAGLGILAMAVALKTIGTAIEQIGVLQPETLTKALIAIGAALAEIAVFMTVMGDASHLIGTAVAIGILALALVKITEAISSLGQLSLPQLGAGLGGLAIALIEMGVALKLLSTNTLGLIGAALAIGILALSLNALIPIITVFSNMDLGQFAMSLGGLALSLTILGAAGAIMGTFAPLLFTGALAIAALGAASLVSAAGLAASAFAIGLLASSLETLNSIGWLDLLSSLGKLIAAFTVLGVGTLLLAPLVPTMLGMALALGVFATACAIAAATVSIAAIGVSLMADALKKFDDISWESIGKGLLVLVGAMVTLGGTAALLAPIAPIILAIGAGVAALGAGALMAASALLLFGEAISVIGPHIKNLGAAISEFASNAWNCIKQAAAQVWNTLLDLGNKLATFILNIGADFVKRIISLASNILHIIVALGAEMLKAIGVPEDWANVARDFMNGLITGISDFLGNVVDKVKDIGKAMIDGIRDAIDSHSDSKETIAVGHDFDGGLITGIGDLKDKVVGKVADVGKGMIDQAKSDAKSVLNIWEATSKVYGKSLEFDSGMRSGKIEYVGAGVGYMNKQTGELKNLISGIDAARAAIDAETQSLTGGGGGGGNSKATKANTKAKKENKTANEKKTKAINDESEALDNETESVEDNEQAIRDQAEEIEVVTERFKEYLKTFGKTDPMKNAKRLTKAFSTLWSTQDTTLSAVTKTYKSTYKTLSKNFKTINKQVLKFNDSGKYLGKFSKSLYKNAKRIEDRVTKTGKTIMKVMGPTTKVFYKVGDSVEKMTISTTKNLKKLGKQFAAAREFVSTFNDDIHGTGNSEDFILTLRSIEKFFGANKFKNMTDKVKNYLHGIVDEFAEFRNPMDILAKNIDGAGNVLSENTRATAYVTDGFIALAASLYDGSEAANEYETEHARLLFLLENGLATEEEVAEHFQSYISRIKEALVEYRTSVQENLAGSMDIWSKFNQNLLEEGTDLIANIESQIAGYYNWGNMLMELSKRGLDSNILKLLTDEGVSSFGKAKALLEMTRSELALFTEDYEMSQAVIQHATDTAIAAMANAQTQASLRAAAAQGNKTAKAQLKQSQKNKKALMDDIKAVAQYRVKYNKLTAKEEKEYLKTLTEEERKYYKKQVKAAKKLKKEQTKLAKKERAKRAEADRLKGIRDSIKAFADYAEVLKKYQNDSKTLTYLLEEETKAFKDLTGVSSNISGNLANANDALLAFADTLDATGEDGLSYFEEMAARVQRYTDEIKDAVKNTDYLKEAFDFTLTSSLKDFYNNAVSNLSGDQEFASSIGKLAEMGYSRDVLDYIVDEFKSDRAQALADMKQLLEGSAEDIGDMNAAFAAKIAQATITAEKTTAAVASTTSRDILETEITNATKSYNDYLKKWEKARTDYDEAEKAVADTFITAEKVLADIDKRINQLKKKQKKGTLTKAEANELKELQNQRKKAYADWEKAASEAGKAVNDVEKKASALREAEDNLIASKIRLNKAQEEYNKYLEKTKDRYNELVKNAEMKTWFRNQATSVEKLIGLLGTLNKNTDEYIYTMHTLNEAMQPFADVISAFDTMTQNSAFTEFNNKAAALNLPVNTAVEGLLKFGQSMIDIDNIGEDWLTPAIKALQEYNANLADSIASSSDFFTMFKEAEEATDPKEMIARAQSQVDALSKWQEAIGVLAARGLSPELLKHFAEQGLSSYNEVLAWAYDATDEDLGEYNTLWEEHQKALKEATDAAMAALAASYSTAGEQMQQAMIDGFKKNGNEKWQEAIEDETNYAIKMVITGIADGVGNAMPEIAKVATDTGEVISSALTDSIDSTVISNGIANSIVSASPAINDTTLTEFDKLSTNVLTATQSAIDEAIEKFKMAVASINKMIEEDIDHEPVITPVVDTSKFDAAIARMNAAISSVQARAAQAQAAANASQANNAAANTANTATTNNTTVNVTQNNTSPKALDQVEIYRQTSNLVNGVTERLTGGVVVRNIKA